MNHPQKLIYGLIGYPVKHSLSALMHNAAFRYLKEQGKIDYDAEYRLFEILPEKLNNFFNNPDEIFEDTHGNRLPCGDVLGFNITIPYKVRAYESARMLEEITVRDHPECILSGAINTVKREKGRLLYRNTDTKGFMESLRTDLEFNTRDKNVLVFGCGGAGRAVIAGLVTEGTGIGKIYVYDINREAVEATKLHFSKFYSLFESLRDQLEFISEEQIFDTIKKSDLLVNASPVGMKEGDSSIIDNSLLHSRLSVYDVVYNRETQLIKDARSLDLHAENGLGMLLYQGALSFELWTNKKAPIAIMRNSLNEGVKEL